MNARGEPLSLLKLAALTCLTIAGVAGAAGVEWNANARGLSCSGPDAKAWLDGGVARIVPVDGPAIATSDDRFNITVADHFGRKVITGIDSLSAIDWEMVIHTIDAQAFRLDLTIRNRGSKPVTLDRLEVLDARLAGQVEPDRNRVLTSGDNSWSGGNVARLEKGGKVESHYTLAIQTPAIAAGFLAGRHNLNRFRLTHDGQGVRLLAYGECNACVLPGGASRSADPLFISGGGNPLAGMEQFAGLAAKENGVQLWPENFATWCSWYAGWIGQQDKSLYKYKAGLEKGVETNIPLVAAYLSSRGAASMRVVDDSFEMAYGDWDNRTLAISRGFDRLAGMMAGKQIRAGVWYPPFWVSTKSRLYREHPELLCRDEKGEVYVEKRGLASSYGNFLAYLDASNPAAAKQIETTARQWRDRGFRYVMTDFLKWGAWTKKRFDPTLTSIETHNLGLAAMRRGYGKDTYWLHCGALLGPAMGLCNGMRISGDSHGEGMYSYVAAGTRWFYNWRVWLNDPDAIVCARYGKGKSGQWNRAWMSWMALAGAVLTYGDTLDDLPSEDMDTYRRILPPLARAGRPLDIFENSPFMFWGMDGGETDGPCTLLGIFELQGKADGRKITVNLDEAAARSRSWTARPSQSPARWLVWDFWGRKLTVVEGANLTMDLPDKSCRVLSVRPDLGRPQLVGTSGHFSQGLLEVSEVKWNARAGRLTGKVRGNGGDATTLFFHEPAGMKCVATSVNYKEWAVIHAEPGAVVSLEVQATPDGPVPFELHFTGQAAKCQPRAFAGGPVGKLSSDN
jgi:alpha-galactosidase